MSNNTDAEKDWRALVSDLVDKGFLAEAEAGDSDLVEDALLRLGKEEAGAQIEAFMADPEGTAKVHAYRQRSAYRQRKRLPPIFGS